MRQFLILLGSIVLATWMGWQIAEGSYALPFLMLTVTFSAVLVKLLRLPIDVIVFGLVLIGYIVGNRGFAQLMPSPRLPLLPAEAALLLCGGWLAFQWAYARKSPVQRDWLNWIIIVWLVIGTARFAFDLPRHGFNAARDYAMVYYAGFFFIAQSYGGEVRPCAYLKKCLFVAATLLPLVFYLFSAFPGFFLDQLTVQGVPLVFFKGDLVATFLACGALIIFHETKGANRYWSWPFATVVFLLALSSNNRATMLGSLIALLWLMLVRRWLFPLIQLATGLLALGGLLGLAVLADNSWATEKAAGLRDRVQSLVDFQGLQRYQSEESGNKGDNNRFRAVWWHVVIMETWEENPIVGLGFGHDLARNFQQEYSLDSTEEFTARAPHSILISAFGRMGLVGAGIFLMICFILAAKTWRALHLIDPLVPVGLWISVWIILVSAFFGVVLEGPMGAVVFWSMLGLAHGSTVVSQADHQDALAPSPTLPPADETYSA